MAIDVKFDLTGNPEPPTIILANRNGNKLGQLKVDSKSISLIDKFNDASEISFTANKYIDDKIIPLWDKIVDFKLIYCKEWDVWFEIRVEFNEETESVKTVFGTQLGYAELSQIKLYDIEINTEKDIDRDDYKITILYDPEDSQASLLDRMFEKAPHYSVIHVDSTIANIQRSFSFDDVSLVDGCQEIEEEIGCLFKFHSNSDEKGMPQRTVSVYDLCQNCNDCDYRGEFTDVCPECGSTNIKYGYGDDTTIFVTSDELASNGIELVADTDSVKNCFKLVAGDDLLTATVRNCNPNGTDYIWYFSDSLKEDMSDELVNKLNAYDNLYKEYYDNHVSHLDTTLLNKYNSLVTKYSIYNEDLQKVETPIKGYSALMNAYYDVIDLGWYLKSGLMPTVKMSETDAKKQASLLTSSSLSPVAVADLSIVSLATMDSAVLSMAKTIVKPTYKVKVNASEKVQSGSLVYWKGNFVITNYSDEEDTAISSTISIRIDDNEEAFIKQKLDKVLNGENTDDLSISGLFKKEYGDFCAELKKYALVPLNSFHDACQACIDVLIEQGVASIENDLYLKLYLPYYNKLLAIESEIKIREEEVNTVIGTYDINGNLINEGLQQEIEECRNTIQKALNFQDYMGEELWLEFCAYRREDKYSNENYISDGLNNAELFSKALEFYKVAENEIYKSAELQHSISATLNNLLAIEKFKPLVNSFNVGNWLRVRIDDNVYKLRLLEYEIDFSDFDNIPVEFSDVTKVRNGITDIESILNQASSMASSYDALTKQANRGDEARSTVRKWLNEGLNTALVQIQNNVNEDIVIDNNGLIGRSYSDITGTYSPEQIRLTHNIIAYTDDDWRTVRQAIGKHKYVMYDNGVKGFVDKVGYGMSAEFVTAGIVSGSQIIGGDIYSDNYSVANGTGSHLNLRDGTFSFGGGALQFNDGKLIISSKAADTNITEINEEWLKTTSVYAKNLQVDAAKINGELTADQINATNLKVDAANIIGALTIGQLEDGTIPTNLSDLFNDVGYVEEKGVTTIVEGVVTTDYINARGIAAENITGTTITGKTLSGGSITIGDNFSVSNSGILKCSSADISGKLNAGDGSVIGGLTVRNNQLETGTLTIFGGNQYAPDAYINFGSSSQFGNIHYSISAQRVCWQLVTDSTSGVDLGLFEVWHDDDDYGDEKIYTQIYLGNNYNGYDNVNNTIHLSGYDGSINCRTINCSLEINCKILNQSSDENFKNIIDWNGLYDAAFMELNPIVFTWKDDENLCKHIGLGARETKGIFEKYGLDSRGIVYYNDKTDSYSVAYSELHALEIKAIQKNRAMIEELYEIINELKK